MVVEAHEKSRGVWNDMAPGWERHRDFMWKTTKHVAEWLVEHVGADDGDTILDLAGGVGDNGFLAAERVGASGRVIITDFAPEMVDVTARRASQLRLTNVETRILDAQDMDLQDDSIDGIICRWGFMLMIDPETALKECRRVLRDGRRLTFSVWSGPEQNPWVTVTGMTMMQLGHQPGNDPFGPGGMFSMSTEDRVRSMVGAAGFSEVTVEAVPVEWRYGSFEEAWNFMTEVAGAIATVVRDLSQEDVARLRSALEENVQGFRFDSGLVLPGQTLNVAAS